MYRNAVALRGVTYQTGLHLCMQRLLSFCGVESWTALVISFRRRLADPAPPAKRKADAQASHPIVLVSLQSMYSWQFAPFQHPAWEGSKQHRGCDRSVASPDLAWSRFPVRGTTIV
mmetsp:Transcript_23365/g.59507  ORF Transcript_23365/g.59507 Transcript_23365/m.59507 type:complete len:116 (+) Transcript_23365:1202-1549(+)